MCLSTHCEGGLHKAAIRVLIPFTRPATLTDSDGQPTGSTYGMPSRPTSQLPPRLGLRAAWASTQSPHHFAIQCTRPDRETIIARVPLPAIRSLMERARPQGV